MGNIARQLFALFNKVSYFLPIMMSNRRFRRSLLLPLYREKARNSKETVQESGMPDSPKTIVYMALPETTFSGGLSDRLRGIVSIYAECKRQGLPFRIVFEPLHLQDYLAPNKYDWRIADKDISWDVKESYPCVLLTYHNNSRNRWQHFVQSTILKSYIRKPYRQIHVYSNMFCKDEEYSPLFHELFKPVPELQSLVDFHLGKLGGKNNYISCTFRFRQLLGDFKEGGKTLPVVERQPYIEKCIETVRRLHEENENFKILVTADSSTFLAALVSLSLPYVYVMPGKVVHVGFTFDADKDTYMKSFLDMYMLSLARTVYQARDSRLMRSGFPIRAALLGNREYKEIPVA